MGTSSMYSGPKDNRLLPEDYIDTNKNNEKSEEANDDNNEESNKDNKDNKELNKYNIDLDAWRKSKNAMSKYVNAKSGNRKNVMNKYASANGGSKHMAKNSTSGIRGVSALGGVLNRISSVGFENTMKEYNIDYKNKSIDSIFSEFINILSPEANTKEESVGRETLIQTLTELYEIIEETGEDIKYFEELDDNKFNFIMNKYIENYIFTRFLNDLEYRVEKYAKNFDKVIQKENDIKDFIKYSVNNATKDINFKNFNYNDLSAIEKIYKDCYDIWEEE